MSGFEPDDLNPISSSHSRPKLVMSSFNSTAHAQHKRQNLTSFAVQLCFFSDSLNVSLNRCLISSQVRSSVDETPRDVIARTMPMIPSISSIASISFSDIFLRETNLSKWNIDLTKPKSGAPQLLIWMLLIKVIQHMRQILEYFVVSARNCTVSAFRPRWITLKCE